MPYETGRSTHAAVSAVSTRESFADFLEQVLADFRTGGEAEWENSSLERFLDAMSAVAAARDADEGQDEESPTWSTFAGVIAAATGYE